MFNAFKKNKPVDKISEPDTIKEFGIKEVGVWLEKLNLGQYTANFKKHKIDGSILLDLTSENLQELGIGVTTCTTLSPLMLVLTLF